MDLEVVRSLFSGKGYKDKDQEKEEYDGTESESESGSIFGLISISGSDSEGYSLDYSS